MEFSDASSLDSLPMVLIIPKSKSFPWPWTELPLSCLIRVLIATIKSLGQCPCPRCFVRKDQIGGLGTVNDTKHRENIRTDNQEHQEKVETARKGIFQKGRAVASKVFETLLGITSIVPTRMSCLQFCKSNH